jgi:hypothetical protein
VDRDSERQWPYDATRLEIIAFRSGIDPDELREWRRDQIAAPRQTPVERPEPPMRLPTAEEWAWIDAQPLEVRAAIVEALLASTA